MNNINFQEVVRKIIGLQLEQVYQILSVYRIPYRVVEQDGIPQTVTKDMRTDRINLFVRQNKVIGAKIF